MISSTRSQSKALYSQVAPLRWTWALGPVTIIAILAALFWRNFLPGASISHLGLVTGFDRIYGADSYGPFSLFYVDPSTPLLHFPNALFIERCVSKFAFPLWNPLNGLGEPFAENIQTMIFSPLHFLFPASCPYWYNLGIVVAIITGALGAYVLGRIIGLSVWPSVFASLNYSLCPHVLNNIELPGQLFFYPWIAALFIWLERKQRPAVSIIVGGVIAVTLYSMHPETFFAAIVGGVLLGCASSLKRSNRITALWAYLKNLSIAGFVSILLGAPVLLPFVDFMRNCDVYKTTSNPLHFYTWNDYLAGLFLPYYDCVERPYLRNPYLGLVSSILLPVGLLQVARKHVPFLAVFFVFFCLSTWMPPSDMVLSQPPFSYMLANYFLPFLILLTTLIAGFGMQLLMDSSQWISLPRVLLIASSVGVLWLNLATSQSWHEIFTRSLELDKDAVLTIIPIASILVISTIAMCCVRQERAFWLWLVLLNAATLSLSVTRELPQTKQFDYPRNDVIDFLSKGNARFLATGDRLLCPNMNMPYGLNDLRSLQVMHPKRYLRFLEAMGARRYADLWYDLPDQFDQLVDVASVKYIATLSCITSKDEADQKNDLTCNSKVGRIAPGVRLTDCSVSYLPSKAETRVTAKWKVSNSARQWLQVQYRILDGKGQQAWRSNWIKLDGTQSGTSDFVDQRVGLPVPRSLESKFVVAARFQNSAGRRWIPDGLTLSTKGENLILAEFQVPSSKVADGNSHFKLAFENKAGIRIYENRRALPEAFLAFSALAANSDDDALERISRPSFHPQSDVVVETNSGAIAGIDKGNHPVQSVPVRWISPNETRMSVDTAEKAVLVLSQFFYPGWEAWVDGKPVSVFHTNYAFQSVILEPGKHEVKFEYRPKVFLYSCLLAGVTALALILLGGFRLYGMLAKSRLKEPLPGESGCCAGEVHQVNSSSTL